MRFIVGAFTAGGGRALRMSGLRPRGAAPVPLGDTPVWAAGYAGTDIQTAASEGDAATVLTAGCPLATAHELQQAARSVEQGTWANAARLPGSYLTVVCSHRTVRVVGDRAGIHTVYWTHGDEEVLWSTSATVLATYRGVTPDINRLLAGISVTGVDPLGSASYFPGVHRVPPGEALLLEPGGDPRTERVPRAHTSLAFADGAGALAEHLEAAVHRRAETGPVSADLSGGVDSSIVTSLAAARTPLLAVTYTDGLLAEHDDVHYARRIAAAAGAITHVEVDGTAHGVGHLDQLEDTAALPVTDVPSLSLGLLAIKQTQLAPAVAHGSRGHLTGRGGDNVLDSIPLSMVDLARTGNRRAAVSRITAYARARRAPVHSALAQAARTARLTQPHALAGLAAQLRGRAPDTGRGFLQPAELLAWCGLLPSASWLTPAGRHTVARLVDEQTAAADPDALPGEVHERAALERMGEEHATYDQIARQLWGLPVHAPYLDSLVVDACLAVPGWQRWVPGDFKPLARAALSGAVPDILLQRRTKTPMTGSLHLGLRTNHRALRTIVIGSRLAQAGLVDPVPILAALDGAARGEMAPLGALHYLIVTELWLTTLPTSRQHWWEPAREESSCPDTAVSTAP
ncbi:albusnodin/ikarugamycin family macrolactam cyclase [Streptomyces wuyuanensis]|uniref:albusnodin/ikarugamycin family macrolactam cyclase n=1 Tax=Streptomyces wuyuanensis TaxID=1196353 RepID=UPI0037160D02